MPRLTPARLARADAACRRRLPPVADLLLAAVLLVGLGVVFPYVGGS